MQHEFTLKTSKRQELIDITSKVNQIIKKSKIKKGTCHLFVVHATAALFIQENADPNIEKDLFKALNQSVPQHNNYLHDKIDNNAQAHILASLLQPSETILINDNHLVLGTWQALMLVELDGPRTRKIIVNLLEG